MKKRFPSFRTIVQASILIIIFSLAILHLLFGIEKAAPIDSYCPFGAVESFFTLLFKGEFLKRIFTSSFILLGIFTIATIFLGRVFCSHFCPLGTVQEWIRNLGRKIGIKKDIEIPERFDKYLRLLKYAVLIAIVYFSFYLGDLVFRSYDPYSAMMHLGREFTENIVGYIVLIVIIIASLFTKNLWCRYLCPLGAFFGILKKISFIRIERNTKTCTKCSICNRSCPANLDIENAKVIKDADCVSCGKCIGSCPKGSLEYKLFNKNISKKFFSVLVILLIIVPLAIAPFTPFWKTKAESNIVNVKGEINTADIRGSNTLGYLIETTKVPLEEFQSKLGLPEEVDLTTKLKDIGAKYDIKDSSGNYIETEAFRTVVDNYIPQKDILQKPLSPSIDCPFGKTECEFPGDCGRYVDSDGNRICDHSE